MVNRLGYQHFTSAINSNNPVWVFFHSFLFSFSFSFKFLQFKTDKSGEWERRKRHRTRERESKKRWIIKWHTHKCTYGFVLRYLCSRLFAYCLRQTQLRTPYSVQYVLFCWFIFVVVAFFHLNVFHKQNSKDPASIYTLNLWLHVSQYNFEHGSKAIQS